MAQPCLLETTRQNQRGTMVSKAVLVSAVAGVLTRVPETACFSTIPLPSRTAATQAAASLVGARISPRSGARWSSKEVQRACGVAPTSTGISRAVLMELQAVMDSEREPDAIDLDIETQVRAMCA